MRAVVAGVSLTLLAIFALTDTSRNFFSPAVVSAPPLPYAVVPAPSIQHVHLNVYDKQQDVPQFVQPAVHVKTSSRAQQASWDQARVATLTVSGQADDETPQFLQEVQELFLLVLRIGTCLLMVHHGFDKIQNVDGFSANVVAKFFGFLPGPPQFWTLSAAATQIVGAGLLGIGLLSRPVAASMSVTMIVAVVFHLLNTGGEAFPLGVPKAHSYNFELAAMYVLVLTNFAVSGAGKYSVDEQIFGGELNIYKGLVAKVFGGGD
jgi:uncharacterized membrane protein YphA (DoxX/SURF4 family)